MNKKLKKKKGFTLIELIIVIAILGILALIAIPKFGSAQKDAKIKADVATAKTIADTTATLVAKGDITIPTDATKDVYKDVTDTSNIVSHMQGSTKVLPKTQYKNEEFKVQLNSEGNVKIVVGSVEIYPGHEGYGK